MVMLQSLSEFFTAVVECGIIYIHAGARLSDPKQLAYPAADLHIFDFDNRVQADDTAPGKDGQT